MRSEEGVRHLLVVGAGVIGSSWAAFGIKVGMDVTVVDPDEQSLERVVTAVDQQMGERRSGVALHTSTDLATSATVADFVIEAAPEQLALKRDIFAILDDRAPEDVLLTSSTSSLPATQIQQACGRHPERVVVAHPFNPPHVMPLVEVVGGERSSAAAVGAVMATLRHWGKRPVRLQREIPGHVANRLQAALWREAYDLVLNGVATPAQVDDVIASGPGLRWALFGPFATQHLSGGSGGFAHLMEHLGGPTFALWKLLGDPEMTPEQQDALVAAVELDLGGVDVTTVSQLRDTALAEVMEVKQAHGLDEVFSAGPSPRAQREDDR